jgi:GT2 family glycosyltransferase
MTLTGRVTVSILTHNRAPELAFTLDRALAACEDAQIIVVDNGSTDATPELVRGYAPRVRHVRLRENAGAAGRNVGVLFATTPYVALCDDDTWWARGSLAAAAAALDEHPRLAIVTARVLVGPEQREDPTCAQMADSPLPAGGELPGPPILGFLAGASMVRRRAFLSAGGFEPRFFLGGEERLLAVDLATEGWSMAYLPGATVHHHPSPARDPAFRRALLARNALWFSWLRRPLGSALRATAHVLGQAYSDPAVLRGALSALGGVAWIARNRQVVPEEVEQALRSVAD